MALGGVLGVVTLAGGGIFWFQQDALAKVNAEVEAKTLEVQNGQQIADQRDAARNALETDRTQIAFLEQGVSAAAYVPSMLKQLEALATSTNNKVLGVRPQVAQAAPTRIQQRRDPDAQGKEGSGDGDKEEKKLPEPYTRLEIEVTLVGKFQSVQTFLDRLNRFPKIVAVDELQLQPHKANSNETEVEGLLDVKLKVTAFVMKEQTPAAQAQTQAVQARAAGGGNYE